MKRQGRHPIWTWMIHTPWVLAVLALVIFFGSGAGNPIITRFIVNRIQRATGARVELQAISIQWLSLRATLYGVALHGKEPPGTEALFAADEIVADVKVESFWGRKFSLQQLLLRHPRIHVRVARDGTSNLPSAPRAANRKPLSQTFFSLRVQKISISDGWLLYNDVRSPLAAQGNRFQFSLYASGPVDNRLYTGSLDWDSVQLAFRRFLPVPVSISTKFSFAPDAARIEQAVIAAGRSRLDAQAELRDFSQLNGTYRYRGWLDLLDIRDVFRSPYVPSGNVDLRGEGAFARGEISGTGGYNAHGIALRLDDFHAGGISLRGSYRLEKGAVDLPDFSASALDGTVRGKVAVRLSGLQFRATTRVQAVRLAKALPAVQHSGFPVDTLHWDSLVDADTSESWNGGFRNFEISGSSTWVPPDQVADGHLPVKADISFHYSHQRRLLGIRDATFATPSTRIAVDGTLAPRNTGLNVEFNTGSLESFQDLINALQGAMPGSPELPRRIGGSASWDGTITGMLARPTFAGRLRGERVHYGALALDSVEGDLTYSPALLKLEHGRLRFGEMDTRGDLSLDLTNWSFLPNNAWSADVSLENTSLDSLQQFAGFSYPVRGQVTGQFHGRGTRRQPAINGLFDLAQADVYGLSFNRLRGQLNYSSTEIRVSDAELRFFAPGTEATRGAGIITGSAGFQFETKAISADLVGAAIPIENFARLQPFGVKLGGQVTLRLKVNGPIREPQANGAFRVVDLRVGKRVIGSFDGALNSDGRSAHLELTSAMTNGEIKGGITFGLAAPFPLDGRISIRNIDLEPLLMAAFHQQEFNGDGIADGTISAKGNLQQIAALAVDADFSRLALRYANVSLQNTGVVHLHSSQQKLLIEPVGFKGTDSNFQLEGTVEYASPRSLNLQLNGNVDLRLLSVLFPALDVRGSARINTAVQGTAASPRITGKVHIENTSARVTDFPTGLTGMQGDLVFDATRLFFTDMKAEAGGGLVTLSGSLYYSERPLRFDVNLKTDRARIRYPEGMSWLAGAALRLSGTTDSAVLSGRVTIQRVTLAQGVEVAGALVSSKEGISGPPTGSTFLRNLQFAIEASSAPDTRLEWPSAELQAEASLRVRGTWERPILLGHIHVFSGDLYFAGNRYQVNRGDINFASPFRLDPVINVEATTNVQQYQITLNFTGLASKLTLSYRSDPPLPSNDIVTLLALGQTSAERTARTGGTTQSPSTSGATALLSEAVSSQLGGRLERLFGITRFRVDPGLAALGSTGSNQNAAARVTVEQRVTRNLTVTYVSNVNSTQQQVIQVEYVVNRNISVVALRDQNGTFGIDFKITKRLQ